MNPFDLLKNLNPEDIGKLRGQVEQVREQLGNIRATGSSGGNMVNITMNGRFEMVDVYLDPICVDNRDVPMLQDLIKAAYNDAMTRVRDQMQGGMLPLGGLAGLFK